MKLRAFLGRFVKTALYVSVGTFLRKIDFFVEKINKFRDLEQNVLRYWRKYSEKYRLLLRESRIFKRKKTAFFIYSQVFLFIKNFRDNWQKDCGRAQNIILRFHWKFWLKLKFFRKRVSFCESSFRKWTKKSSAVS